MQSSVIPVDGLCNPPLFRLMGFTHPSVMIALSGLAAKFVSQSALKGREYATIGHSPIISSALELISRSILSFSLSIHHPINSSSHSIHLPSQFIIPFNSSSHSIHHPINSSSHSIHPIYSSPHQFIVLSIN